MTFPQGFTIIVRVLKCSRNASKPLPTSQKPAYQCPCLVDSWWLFLGLKQEGRRAGSASGFKTESAGLCSLLALEGPIPGRSSKNGIHFLSPCSWLPHSHHIWHFFFGILSHCGILAELEFHSPKQTSDKLVSILVDLIRPWEGITRPGPLY